jgi:hypothetical protein
VKQRKPLERHTPLRQGKPLARTPFRSSGENLNLKRRGSGPVKARSESTHIPGAIRAAVLERDNRQCQRCGQSIETVRYGLQHRRPRQMGGSALLHTMANLVTLCGWTEDAGSCTRWVELEDRPRATVEGWLVPNGATPEAWPVLRLGSWQQPGDTWTPCEPHPRQIELGAGAA